MPVTNPWLTGPTPTKRLDRHRLEERILNLLSSQNMCVLAGAGSDGPLAMPVRYFHLDFTVIFTAAPQSPKLRNIAVDPRASIGIFAPLIGQASSRGRQLVRSAVVTEGFLDVERAAGPARSAASPAPQASVHDPAPAPPPDRWPRPSSGTTTSPPASRS